MASSAAAKQFVSALAECAEMLKTIPILHLHGDLGGLPYLDKERVRAYNPTLDKNNIDIAASRIRIIHEATNDPIFNEAKEILQNSEVIRFLGFGYHPLNLERLGVVNTPPRIDSHKWGGSSYGLTFMESAEISGKCGFNLRPDKRFTYENLDVLNYLRETVLLT